MSMSWSAISGVALVLDPNEAEEFYKKYLFETYQKDGVTDDDINHIEDVISENGCDFFYFLRSADRTKLMNVFPTIESCGDEKVAKKYTANLFTIMEYSYDECSGGMYYPFEQPEEGSCFNVDDGSIIIFTDKSTKPQDILQGKSYSSTSEIIDEFKSKLAAYLPVDFDWEKSIGFFQCAAYA